MGVVTASSSTLGGLFGLSAQFQPEWPASKRALIMAFKTDKAKDPTLFTAHDSSQLPRKTAKEPRRPKKASKPPNRVSSVTIDEVSPCTSQVDYDEAAAKLESIFNLSPAADVSVAEREDCILKDDEQKMKIGESDKKKRRVDTVVRNRGKRGKRMSLDQRIALSKKAEDRPASSILKEKDVTDSYDRIETLLREYPDSGDLFRFDWNKMKIPQVLPSKEQAWLFKLMQHMKALRQVKENLQKELGREPTDRELAETTNLTVVQLRRYLKVGSAARNKLIKHNLRLVMFALNKYFPELVNNSRFQDMCQAGVQGLITAIDRFELKRCSQLSTYSLFWIRHAMTRSLTVSNFTRVPFGLESVRSEIQKAKLELSMELQRPPTVEEIIEKVGISAERYRDVMNASKPVLSLHARNPVTQEELISGVADIDGAGSSRERQHTLRRLALDDVLDSLKPKESLVIRQRYGLDGKGERTLGEVAKNLNISREMVRKYELKALMKLKHPTRVDHLRSYVFQNE